MLLCGLLLFVISQALAQSQPTNGPASFDFIVASDGSGHFTSVQAALDAVPPFRKKRTYILVRSGTYHEKLSLSAAAQEVSLIGESAQTTILTFDDFASRPNRFGEEMGTSSSASFFVFGDGFEAQNITFANTAGPVGQAVAVRITADRVRFENCRFLGFQDTLYAQGKTSRQYYKNCYIEGTVDFVFGWATAVFDSCHLFCKSPGYITAPATEAGQAYGFVFRHCNIGGSAPPGSVYLGRPWRPYGRAVFIDCHLSEVVQPEGWHNWNKPEAESTSFFAEFNSYGEGASMARRVHWAHVLSPEEAAPYYVLSQVFGDWDPAAPK